MNRRDFISDSRDIFKNLCDDLFSELRDGEDLIVNYWGEDTLFVRFNGGRVRQNTTVEKLTMELKLQWNGRTAQRSLNVSGTRANDREALTRTLHALRSDARILPADPHQVPIANNGSSEQVFRSRLLAHDRAVEAITAPAEGVDLTGLLCSGPVVQGNRNSKGQDHWFATENFFFDYSLYDGAKAVKSGYADRDWNDADWARNLARSREQLSLLDRPVCDVKPGKYRTYLAPGAVAELTGMLSWGAVSTSAWKQGRCAFKKLIDGEAKLSPKFTLRENFSMGLTPRFNSLGEVAPETVSVIASGEIQQLLTSSRSAKEYGLQANGAESWEGLRAPEIASGTLDEKDVLRQLGTGLYLSNLHYLNWSDPTAARLTGMTRFACFWVEDGEIKGPIKDLRFDVSLYEVLGNQLVGFTDRVETEPAVSTYGGHPLGGTRVPGALIDDFTFTL